MIPVASRSSKEKTYQPTVTAHHPIKTNIRSKTHIVKKSLDAKKIAKKDAAGLTVFHEMMTPETEELHKQRKLKGFGGFGGGLATSGSFSMNGGGTW